MSHHPNFLLAQLSPGERARVAPFLTVVPLERRQVLAEPRDRISRVYFPHTGVLSFMVDLPEGGSIATGMMGRDGVFGGSQALDDRMSLNRVAVQVAGEASVINASALCQLALDVPRLRKLILGYDQFFFAYVQQTAACNAVHNVRQRCCRWLLRMQALAGDELVLTHDLLGQMIGVRRTSVSTTAKELQAEGLISYHRGCITIVDHARLHAAACGCEDEANAHFEVLFANEDSDTTQRRVAAQ